jgi:hypothetical protein
VEGRGLKIEYLRLKMIEKQRIADYFEETVNCEL